MKPLSPHNPLDDLIAAALHGELTPEERAQFDSRLSNDPAARAAYQEAQAMHDLLEKTHQSAQPDSAFEQRMVSGVRRKLQTELHRETAWESVLALWTGVKTFVTRKRTPLPWLGSALAICLIFSVLAGVALGPITRGIKQTQGSAEMQEAHQKALADYQAQVDAGNPNPVMKDLRVFLPQEAQSAQGQANGVFSTITSQLAMADNGAPPEDLAETMVPPMSTQAKVTSSGYELAHLDNLEARYQKELEANPSNQDAAKRLARIEDQKSRYLSPGASRHITLFAKNESAEKAINADQSATDKLISSNNSMSGASNSNGYPAGAVDMAAATGSGTAMHTVVTPTTTTQSPLQFDLKHPVAKAVAADTAGSAPSGSTTVDSNAAFAPASTTTTSAIDSRKLIRNAQLDLEVKSFQAAMDQITAMTNAAGGYVDTSNSEKGGNGKLHGSVVAKVLPQNLDAFLLKLRDLGEVKNQSVGTDDVTKDYFDTQARLENSRRMETQLQELLKRENGKVSDLLEVERELGRVRGDIEQMQGQLKLYDFQVQYATVTIQMSEKNLNHAAAYLLNEQDDFSLFATDVEGTYLKARSAANSFNAQILNGSLNHNSGSDVSAELELMIAPEQIDPFLAQIRSLGRVANFTRQTQSIANDGGESDEPADQNLTIKAKVRVHLAIRSDDETRKQVALTVVAKAVDDALDQAKKAALANDGVEILSSSLNKTPEGESTAQLSVRVPGKDYDAEIEAFRGLGRMASIEIRRNDDSGPGASGDDVPVIIALSLTDNDTPLQQTEMSVVATDVDGQSQQIKKDAADAGVEVKASSFERQPDGNEVAQMTFRLPMAKYPAFLGSLKKLGKVESLSVHRDDRPDQTCADDTAPAEISLQLRNEADIVADNSGLWPTLRQTFGEGAAALFGSIRVIGVALAFLTPWAFTLGLFAWIGRRIYVWRKG